MKIRLLVIAAAEAVVGHLWAVANGGAFNASPSLVTHKLGGSDTTF